MAIMNQVQQPARIYIHLSTSNKSFLDMHYYLKSIGIQNNDFFLALLDPGLVGVDPRDPTLTVEMKIRILRECQLNYWYFLREIIRIPEQGNTVGGGSQFGLHRGNLAMNFLYVLNQNFFLELPRQMGKTTAAVCRYLWVYNFGTSNSEIMFMHKDHNGSKGNLKTLKNIRDALPSYLQMSSAIGADGKKLKVPNTIVTIQQPYNNNRVNTYPSARTKESATNLGRGCTIPCIYMDEFAFMPFNKVVLEAAAPAFSRASMNAAKNGAPYGMVLTTTPGDLLTDSGRYAFEVRNNATPFVEQYYDCTIEQIQGIISSNKLSNMWLLSFSYKQLGFGPEYLTRMLKDLQGDYPSLRREVLLEWAEIANNCPFTQEELDVIKNYTREPIRQLRFGKFGQYIFDIFEDMDLAYPPIIGVDVAGATFNDSSAITIVDSKTTRVCANLHCNFIPADDLADVIYQIVVKYLPNSIICVERNGGFGIAVVQRLCKTSVKKNLYWELKEKVIEEEFTGVFHNKHKRMLKVYGLDSTKAVRARLIEILMERVHYHKDKFVAPVLHTEMQSMEVKKNGKVEHSDNSHDDNVFSYLMAMYVWYDGKNLAENFGIRKSTIKTDENIDMEEAQFEDALESGINIDYSPIINNEEDAPDSIYDDLQWIEHDMKSINSKQMLEQQTTQNAILKSKLLTTNKDLKRQLEEKEFGVISYNQYMTNAYTDLPETIFDIDTDFDIDDEMNNDPYASASPYAGNLSSMIDFL